MSVWSQVAGIIRIDGIQSLDGELNFDELIGKECRWDDPIEMWNDQEKYPEKYLPMGSEGSLHKSVWVNTDKSGLDAYTVSIFGSLRDHTDVNDIITWFKNICNRFVIRNATITIDNDLNGITNWTYNSMENGTNDLVWGAEE